MRRKESERMGNEAAEHSGEIIHYLAKYNEKEIEHIYKDARKIYNEYLDIAEYFHKNY